MRSMGHNKSVDIFSFRSHETETPVKSADNVARYAPTKSEKKVKFIDDRKSGILDRLE